MKATIKFKLPDDSYEFAIHNMASDMAGLLWELTHNVKKKCEWAADQVDPINANIYDGIDIVFEKITELLNDYNIDSDKLG
jgi:hypothetical protein